MVTIMKNRYAPACLAVFLLSAVLLLASCGGGTSAATMHLVKTEGTVGVSDGDGRDIDPMENLGLYSGYQVGTRTESYAWINLDDVKLTKMDAESQVEIARDGGKLEINVKSGSLFFNVTEPLSDDESMDIRTSSMLVGIRGTCGWVTQDTAALLEGTVTVTAEGESATVTAGEMAVLTDEGALEVKPLTAASVPAFVQEEIADDEDLAAVVLDTAEMDSAEADPMAPYEDAMAWDFNEVQYTEFIDFTQDGEPELLVIGTCPEIPGENNFRGPYCRFLVYKAGAEMEGSSSMSWGGAYGAPIEVITEQIYALVELDGRLFLKTESPGWEQISYYGFNDEGQWCSEAVEHSSGITDEYYYTSNVSLNDRSENTRRECSAEEFDAVQAKYRDVRVLMRILDHGRVVFD